MTLEIPPSAKKYFNDAVGILQENLSRRQVGREWEQVVGLLRQAVNEYPKFLEAWRLLGEVYLGTEQPLYAYLALKRAHYIKGDDPAIAVLLGEISLVLDRPELALKYLGMASSAEDVPAAVKKMTALALARSEEWEPAIRAFGEALAEDPADGDMRRECTEVLRALGYDKEAASVLADYLDPYREFIDTQQSILESGLIMQFGTVLDRMEAGARKKAKQREVVAHPEDYRAWYSLGNVLYDADCFEGAISCYRRALRIHPDYYDALNNMGLALEELGRGEEALQMYEAAMETDPDSPDAYLSIAELLEELSPQEADEIAINYLMYYRRSPEAPGFEEVEPDLVARLEKNPDISQSLQLAHVYLLRCEVEKADRVLKGIESAGSGEAILQWLRGEVFYENGNIEGAELAYRKGLENMTGEARETEGGDEEDIEPRLRMSLAELFIETDRDEEAIKVLTDGEESLDSDGLAFLGELLCESKSPEAEKVMLKSLESDPEHMDSLIGLAELKMENGKLEEAAVFLERAYKADPEDEEVIKKLSEIYPEIGVPELSPGMEEEEEFTEEV
jgi:tetratricopeptide (TPR) repeat protein